MDGPVADGRHPRLVRPGELDALDLRDNLTQQGLRLHRRQCSADAAMNTIAPAERMLGVAVEPVLVRRVPEARVAIGGREHKPAAAAGGNYVVVDRNIAGSDAPGHAARR